SFSKFDPNNNQSYFIEIFNKGNQQLDYNIKAKEEWIKLSSEKGKIQYDEKVYVSIDWLKAPKGESIGEIIVSGAGSKYTVNVPIRNNVVDVQGFIENNGVVSIEAANFTQAVNSDHISWTVIPNLGRTYSSVIAEPANASSQALSKSTPHLEYVFTVFNEGDLKIESYLSPTLNYQKNEGLKFAISIDDNEPQIVNMHEGEYQPDWEYPAWWNNSVLDHIKKKKSAHGQVKPGKHTLKVWMVDPGVVFQKFVLDIGGIRPSYLGPPESLKFINGSK
ncbi:MAG: hypothetical protein OQJ81_07945, partial [Melioribacteraceae bacterium]|nr:hypothetical protein [Melioribacteraceae bacterium]